MRYFLYKITNKINNKIYIGKTNNINRRWSEHQKMASRGKEHPLYDSMRKHGLDSFTFEVIQETTEDLVDIIEVQLIDELSKYPKGYNLARGGSGGDTFTNLPEDAKEQKRKQFRELRLSKPQGISTKSEKGKHITATSPEIAIKWKSNYSKAMNQLSNRRSKGDFTQKELEGHAKVRDHWSQPDNKEKRSKLAQGKNNSRWLGYLEVYSAEGDLLEVFESAKEAGVVLGITANTIRIKARSGEPYKCKKPKFKNHTGLTFKFNAEYNK